MDSSQPRVPSANLSRAYAALRRLDVLRAQDVIDPVNVVCADAFVPRAAAWPATGPSPMPQGTVERNNTHASPQHGDERRGRGHTTQETSLTHAVPTAAPAAAPPRFQPLSSPSANTSLFAETSRLTHPTTLASSSFFSATGTPLVEPSGYTYAPPRESPSITAPSTHMTAHPPLRHPQGRDDVPRSHPLMPVTVTSPSPHIDVEHRYRPRRGLGSASSAVNGPSAGAAAVPHSGAQLRTSWTQRDRVGDYRGHGWDDDASIAALALADSKPLSSSPAPTQAQLPPPRSSSQRPAPFFSPNAPQSVHEYHVRQPLQKPPGPSPPPPPPLSHTAEHAALTDDGFFDKDPALQVAVALTRGGCQPLSIARDSTDRAAAAGAPPLLSSYAASSTSLPMARAADAEGQHPARQTRSPLLSTQDRNARHTQKRALAPPLPNEDDDSEAHAESGSPVGRTTGDRTPSSSRRTSSSPSSGSSSDADESSSWITPRVSERPFVRVGARPAAALPPPPRVTSSRRISAASDTVTAEAAPTRDEQTAAPLVHAIGSTKRSAAVRAAQQLMDAYQARQTELRGRLHDEQPAVTAPISTTQSQSPSPSPSPAQSTSRASARTLHSAEATAHMADVTQAGETESAARDEAPSPPSHSSPQAHDETTPVVAAHADEKADGAAAPLASRRSTSSLRPPLAVSYKDYLVQSPRPRSTTASHERPLSDVREGASPPASSRASAEGSPPRLTTASDAVVVGVQAHTAPSPTTTTANVDLRDTSSSPLHPPQRRKDVVDDNTSHRHVMKTPNTDQDEDLVDFVKAIHVADAETLIEVLSSMAARDGNQKESTSPAASSSFPSPEQLTALFTEDCLGLTVVMNKRVIIEEMVVPWLIHELEAVHATIRTAAPRSAESEHRSPTPSVPLSHALLRQRRDALLCALTGLGSLALSASTTLQALFVDLTAECAEAESDDDDTLALVLLAMRATGGEAAVRYLCARLASRQGTDAVTVQRRRAAAAYGLGLMSFSVTGYTTVLCVPLGTESEAAQTTEVDRASPPRLVLHAPEGPIPSPSYTAEDAFGIGGGSADTADSETQDDDQTVKRDGGSPDGEVSAPRTTQPPYQEGRLARQTGNRLVLSVLAPPSLQQPPAYTPTHVLVDVHRARASLCAFIASRREAFAVPDASVNLGVVLHEVLELSLPHAVAPDEAEDEAQATWGQAMTVATGEQRGRPSLPASARTPTRRACVERGQALIRAGLSAIMETIEATWSAPILPHSYTAYMVERPGLVFDVERALLNAAIQSGTPTSHTNTSTTPAPASVSRAAARVQEVAMIALASLPPQARLHVAVPLLEYAERHATTSAAATGGVTLPATFDAALTATRPINSSTLPEKSADDNASAVDRAATQSAFGAAALALGCVATPLAVSPSQLRRTAALLCALVRQSPAARVRHGAMAGLGFLAAAWLEALPAESAVADPGAAATATTAMVYRQPATAAAHEGTQEGDDEHPFRRVLPVVLRLCAVCLLDSSVSAETVAWASARCGPAGARHLLHLLRSACAPRATRRGAEDGSSKVRAMDGERATPRLTTHAQLACVQALLTVPFTCPSSLLDEVIDTLGTLTISQGLVEEEVQRACVRVLARTVATASASAPGHAQPSPSSPQNGWLVSARPASLTPPAPEETLEVFDYYTQESPTETFKVLRSILESATVPYSVLCEMFRCLCLYGGAHGELYTCQTCLESTITAARGAAAHGLRGAGARAIRVLALALNDDAADVRREAEATVAHVGIASIVSVLSRRPATHWEQVTAALRDCVLRDLGRGQTHATLDELYEALNSRA